MFLPARRDSPQANVGYVMKLDPQRTFAHSNRTSASLRPPCTNQPEASGRERILTLKDLEAGFAQLGVNEIRGDSMFLDLRIA